MDNRRVALAGILIFFLFTATIATILLSDESTQLADSNTLVTDPLIQDEGHDHRNASQHIFYTDNIQPISFNQLTAPGNAEVQVADSPDGGTYAYIAGLSYISWMSQTLRILQLPESMWIQILKFWM